MSLVSILLVQLLVFGSVSHAAMPTPATASTILSFKEWKNDKSVEVRNRYNKLESEYVSKKTVNPKDTSLKALYSELKNTKLRLEEMGELTVSDYFVGYLSQLKDPKRVFQAAAEKLDSAEVAELMEAYADSLLKTSGEGISTNPKGTASEASK